jgi:hypothetical protein
METLEVVGAAEGVREGLVELCKGLVVGAFDGDADSSAGVGDKVGALDGISIGDLVGGAEGSVVGASDGAFEGPAVGCTDGAFEGPTVGFFEESGKQNECRQSYRVITRQMALPAL